jgi:hypothetical protein
MFPFVKDIVLVPLIITLVTSLLQGHSVSSFSCSKMNGTRKVGAEFQLNGYLDSLSNNDNDNNDNNGQKKDDSFIKPSDYKTPGIIPSGRGPLGSYLDAVSSSNSDSISSSTSESNDIEKSNAVDESYQTPRATTRSRLTTIITGTDDARTDIRNLLTQRAIQSFLRLCEECRDPHSAKWIKDFLNIQGNLVDYHGTGSKFIEDYQGVWDAPLIDMIRQPKDVMVVSAKRRGRGHGGWSKHNPYLEERWVEISINIDPANLAHRILAVREQIANEWLTDINVLMQANDDLLQSFFDTVKSQRDSTDTVSGSTNISPNEAFERTASFRMDAASRASTSLSSPLRRANFDLMYNLCTQAAIHRILRQHKVNMEEKTKYNTNPKLDSFELSTIFLKDFYLDRAEEYFDGNLEFGQADNFMEELLQTSPRFINVDNNSGSNTMTASSRTKLVDPVGAAELIIQMKKEVAEDWRALMSRVSEDHTRIRQNLYTNQILRSNDSNEMDDVLDGNIFQ